MHRFSLNQTDIARRKYCKMAKEQNKICKTSTIVNYGTIYLTFITYLPQQNL